MEEICTSTGSNDLPFSEAIEHNGTVYVSGQGPLDPGTGEVLGTTAGDQTDRTLDNVERILEAAGTSLDSAVQVTVYLTDMENYEEVNEVYAERFSEPFPSRTAVEVSDLPVDIEVELTVVAAA